MTKNIFKTIAPLVLASGSPRRKDFLTALGLEFSISIPEVNEQVYPHERPEEFVGRISVEKALAIAAYEKKSWVLAADTVVVVEGEILGKPADDKVAFEMIKRLSGRQHSVWTGFCLCNIAEKVNVQRSVETFVKFAALSDDVCRAYAQSHEPLDKAGAYGIQGKGGFMVESISGSYSNVVGLPLSEVIKEMISYKIVRPGS